MSSPWQLGKDLKSRNAHLLETEDLSDCTFVVAGEEVKAHKLLVSAASALLQEKLQAADEEAITLKDVELDIFKLMLKYIYTDAVDIASFDIAYRLGVAANIYQLSLLAERCSKYLTATPLTAENVSQAYELAICTDDKELTKKCEEVIKTKTKEVLESSSFLDMCVCTLAAMFSFEPLNIDSELVLLDAADRYHRHHNSKSEVQSQDDGSSDIRSALEQIRLLSLTPRQFVERRMPLVEVDACAVLANIVSTNSKVPMPEGFSTKRFRMKTVNDYTMEQATHKYVPENKDVVFTDFYLKEPLKIGSHLVLWATAPSSDRNWFVINLGHTVKEAPNVDVTYMGKVALHFRPYLSSKEVVRNTSDKDPPAWGPEEKKVARPFPFVEEQQFKLEIIVEEKQTVWLVNDLYFCTYAHRTPSTLGATRVQVINIDDPTMYLQLQK